jgi:hypothetical protein
LKFQVTGSPLPAGAVDAREGVLLSRFAGFLADFAVLDAVARFLPDLWPLLRAALPPRFLEILIPRSVPRSNPLRAVARMEPRVGAVGAAR